MQLKNKYPPVQNVSTNVRNETVVIFRESRDSHLTSPRDESQKLVE